MAAPTFGTAAQFSSSTARYWVTALSATTFVIAYQASGGLTAVVASISGTTITYGTSVILTANSSANESIGVVALSSTSFVAFYRNSSSGTYSCIASTTDGNITISSTGTTVDLPPAGSVGSTVNGWCVLSSTHFVVGSRASDSNSYVYVGSVSGNTITLGTRVAFGAGANPINRRISLVGISSTHFATIYNKASTTSTAFVCSVSGTTITKGTDYDYTTTDGSGDQAVFAVDSTHFGIVWNRSAGGTNGATSAICTFSGTTISAIGTKVEQSSPNTGNLVGACKIDDTHFVTTWRDNTATGRVVIGTISGAAITYDTAANFVASSIDNGNLGTSVALLGTTKFVTIWAVSDVGQARIGEFSIAGAVNSGFFNFM